MLRRPGDPAGDIKPGVYTFTRSPTLAYVLNPATICRYPSRSHRRAEETRKSYHILEALTSYTSPARYNSFSRLKFNFLRRGCLYSQSSYTLLPEMLCHLRPDTSNRQRRRLLCSCRRTAHSRYECRQCGAPIQCCTCVYVSASLVH